MGWSELVRTHIAVIAATDFLTVEVLTLHGLVTYYVLFVMRIGSRRVHLAGNTDSPNETWMKTVAIQLTADYGFLKGMRYLIHDRDAKFTAAFRAIIEPRAEDRVGNPHGRVRCRERPGGLLRFYHRAA